jgi:hypothetical protein
MLFNKHHQVYYSGIQAIYASGTPVVRNSWNFFFFLLKRTRRSG